MLVVLATPETNDAISSPGVLLPPSSSGQGSILPPSSVGVGGGGGVANQSDYDGQTSSQDRGVQRQKAFGGRRHSRQPSSSTIAPECTAPPGTTMTSGWTRITRSTSKMASLSR